MWRPQTLAEAIITVNAVTIYEAWFYGVAMLFACAAGISRVIRDGEYQSVSNLVGVGFCSGFLGFASIALLSGANGLIVGYEFRYLAVSTLVGLMGREQDQLIKYLVKKMFIAIGATKK